MGLYLSEIFKSNASQKSIGEDFSRVLGWTEMLKFAIPEEDEYRIPMIVPVSREHGPNKEENELIQKMETEYVKDIKRKLPSRTFDFSSVVDIVKI